MKKTLLILTSLLLVFGLSISLFTSAVKAEDQERSRSQDVTTNDQDDESDDSEDENEVEDEVEPDDDTDDDTDDNLVSANEKRFENQIKKLERIQERINNPEIGNQIQQMTEEQNQIQERAEIAIEKIEGRPAYLRFLIGPDYRNAGELRSHIVQIRNQIRQLEQLQEKVTDQESDDIQEVIDGLNEEADSLEQDLSLKLEGFSLFGWLARLFAGY